ncbi:TetR/AcrR family transcriptional regulator [Hazenella sp. IB182353]|uniref:TetR/AcrR family transcriptional regulator n=1 Tax=Polycladospora coralii TaxID=2771432 RepID=UPI00174610B7|nr:TetR/AcrR family transcriptional regulator [Polycladospora coralii]MBS7530576.1 TetR/AcrR family transcriptional regulator [Polycladospora coralii]
MAIDYSRREQAKRQQIREGAKQMFFEKGFSRATTDAIAAKAGVSKQTLYAYYPTKEDLMVDLLRHLMSDILHQWPLDEKEQAIISKDQLRKELTEQAQSMITDIMQPEYLSLVRVIVAESPRLPQLGDLFRETICERALDHNRLILERARGEVVSYDLDVEAASHMFVGFLLMHAIHGGLLASEGKIAIPAPTIIDTMIDLYLKAIT